MPTYTRCANCGLLMKKGEVPNKKYHSNACRMQAYRRRKKKGNVYAKVTFTRYCVNCGKTFTTTRVRQQFHSASCRSSFWQQQKRLAAKEGKS